MTYFQGTGVTEALVYLWKYDDRIVISDIDGTVTKLGIETYLLSFILFFQITENFFEN